MENDDNANQKWGNSLALRIPRGFSEALAFGENSRVVMSVRDGSLIVTPVKRKRYDLNDLLEQMTPENLHKEEDWGPAAGVEEW